MVEKVHASIVFEDSSSRYQDSESRKAEILAIQQRKGRTTF